MEAYLFLDLSALSFSELFTDSLRFHGFRNQMQVIQIVGKGGGAPEMAVTEEMLYVQVRMRWLFV